MIALFIFLLQGKNKSKGRKPSSGGARIPGQGCDYLILINKIKIDKY
jgi:hypothetical protein